MSLYTLSPGIPTNSPRGRSLITRPTLPIQPFRVSTSRRSVSGTGGRPDAFSCTTSPCSPTTVPVPPPSTISFFLGDSPYFLIRFSHASSIDFSTPSSAARYSVYASRCFAISARRLLRASFSAVWCTKRRWHWRNADVISSSSRLFGSNC